MGSQPMLEGILGRTRARRTGRGPRWGAPAPQSPVWGGTGGGRRSRGGGDEPPSRRWPSGKEMPVEAAPRREIGLQEVQAGGRRKRGCPGCDMGADGAAPGFEQRS